MIPGKKYAPEDFLRIAWRRKWIILVPLVVAAVGTFFYSRTLPNRYRSEAVVLIVPQQVPENFIRATVEESVAQRLDLMRQQILTRPRLERIIEDFGLYTEERKVLLQDQVIDQMRRDIGVDVQKVGRKQDPNHFVVSYESEDPQMAKNVAERLASLFLRENVEARNLQTDATTSILQSNVNEALARLQEQERRLEEFKKQNAGRLPDQIETNLQLMTNTRQQIQTLTDGLNSDRERRIAVDRLIAEETALIGTSAPNRSAARPEDAQAQTAAQQLASARGTLDAMLLRFKEDHPDVRMLRGRIKDLEKRAEDEALRQPMTDGRALAGLPTAEIERQRRISQLRGELESLDREMKNKQAGIQRAQATLAAQERSVQAAPALQSQMADLLRDSGTMKQSYEQLLKKLQDAKLAGSLEQRQVSQQFKILDPARRPERPRSPDRIRMNLIGALLGLGLGFAIAGLLEYRDTSLRTADDVVVALSLPVLALVPTMRTPSSKPGRRRRWLLLGSSATMLLVSLAAAAWQWRLFEGWSR